MLNKFTLKDKIFFLKEMSYLLNWWVSIPVALETIKNNTEKQSVKQVCDDIYSFIKRWETFSRALTALDEYFTEWDVNKIPKPNRDSERFVKYSNGDVYYTNNHYETFIKIIN